MTVTHKLFKILSGHNVANGRTDRQTYGRTDGRTDERHTIICPKFYFGRIKIACFLINAVEVAKMFVNYSFFRLCLLHMAKICEGSYFVKIFEIFLVQRNTSVHLQKKMVRNGRF